mgnify:CR=1 FL=1
MSPVSAIVSGVVCLVAALTIGPANLLYFRQLVEYDKLPRRQWLHILPALGALIVLIMWLKLIIHVASA